MNSFKRSDVTLRSRTSAPCRRTLKSHRRSFRTRTTSSVPAVPFLLPHQQLVPQPTLAQKQPQRLVPQPTHSPPHQRPRRRRRTRLLRRQHQHKVRAALCTQRAAACNGFTKVLLSLVDDVVCGLVTLQGRRCPSLGLQRATVAAAAASQSESASTNAQPHLHQHQHQTLLRRTQLVQSKERHLAGNRLPQSTSAYLELARPPCLHKVRATEVCRCSFLWLTMWFVVACCLCPPGQMNPRAPYWNSLMPLFANTKTSLSTIGGLQWCMGTCTTMRK